jgi:hypothetical protein
LKLDRFDILQTIENYLDTHRILRSIRNHQMIVYCLLFLLAVPKCTVILGESQSGGHTSEDFSRVRDEQLSLLKPASQGS